ncbi:MAG: argininosuccinate lyase [Actinobacteria bacterium]|nr:argininosuccinate lyase [Actinomycetota bacterium]
MKLWGGRFEKKTEELVHAFSCSLSFDRRLAPYDIEVSRAHALALQECGVLTREEAEDIAAALHEIKQEMENGTFEFAGDEDIHTAVERSLVERLGDAGAKLRAGRSRNDQVAADLRLYLKDASTGIKQRLLALMESLLEQAESHPDAPMPGFTHLQPAQPVLLSHHLLAYFEMLKRDLERVEESYRRQDVCPLGSGALAGVTFALDREMIADHLGFGAVTANSIDAVSDRDFACDFLYACSMIAVHLSRLAEEMVQWSTPFFGFLELDEAYTTGSSIMPQKANPDVAELVRGKTGRVIGHLVAVLTMLKGLPLSYDRDLQEDKEGTFDVCDQLASMLEVMSRSLATAEFKIRRMKETAEEGYANATDLADYLVRKGMPFLEAHNAAGRLVRLCMERGIGLEELPLSDYQEVQPLIGDDIYECLSLEACLKARDIPGGTAPACVEGALSEARDWLDAARRRS